MRSHSTLDTGAPMPELNLNPTLLNSLHHKSNWGIVR